MSLCGRPAKGTGRDHNARLFHKLLGQAFELRPVVETSGRMASAARDTYSDRERTRPVGSHGLKSPSPLRQPLEVGRVAVPGAKRGDSRRLDTVGRIFDGSAEFEMDQVVAPPGGTGEHPEILGLRIGDAPGETGQDGR